MRQRFNQILAERHEHFDLYKSEAWKYFDEFIPFLQATLPAIEPPKVEKKVEPVIKKPIVPMKSGKKH